MFGLLKFQEPQNSGMKLITNILIALVIFIIVMVIAIAFYLS